MTTQHETLTDGALHVSDASKPTENPAASPEIAISDKSHIKAVDLASIGVLLTEDGECDFPPVEPDLGPAALLEMIRREHGITPDSIEAARAERRALRATRSSGHREAIILAIREHGAAIRSDLKADFVSAKSVLSWFDSKNVPLTKSGRKAKRANFLGDSLGGQGLCLPFVIVGGRKHYDFLSLNRTPDENKAKQAALDMLSAEELTVLRVA